MLETLRKGDSYNSILAWHPDRLARNMKESGEILDLLDNEIIVDLQFPSYSFTNDAAGKMTLSILFAMAKEFSDKLSDDTKRGLNKKVTEGKYCGSVKRGYYNNKDDYFREDKNTFSLYVQAWREYTDGKTQKEILNFLSDNGTQITTNQLSSFFADPFYAGIYCYGNNVTNIQSVDPQFKPMISPKEFILVQRINREQPRGWTKTSKFRPFREFIICKNCKKIMTSGLSTGKAGIKYLSVTCGNSKCREERQTKGIKPIANTIRGKEIVDFAIKFIEEELKIDEKIYKKAKKMYLEEKNKVLKSNNEEIKKLKSKKTKAETETKKISKRLLDEKNINVAQKLSDDCNIILKETKEIEKQIKKYEAKNKEYELTIETEFPSYKEFMNFFENIVDIIQNTNNPYLIDQLLKLVFLNLTIDEKKSS
jgi:site-specific DNA recombinase